MEAFHQLLVSIAEKERGRKIETGRERWRETHIPRPQIREKPSKMGQKDIKMRKTEIEGGRERNGRGREGEEGMRVESSPHKYATRVSGATSAVPAPGAL